MPDVFPMTEVAWWIALCDEYKVLTLTCACLLGLEIDLNAVDLVVESIAKAESREKRSRSVDT
jgi:hypothetical protein